VEALTRVAVSVPHQIDHVAQRLRDERAEQAGIKALTEPLNDAVVVVIEFPGWDSPGITRPDRLGDSRGARLTPGAHATYAGHRAYFTHAYDGHRPEYVCMDPKVNGHARTD
jgi:ParB family chromosome partitioning protein